MDWKQTVNRINRSQYSWPKGWTKKEDVAAQLECSTDRLDTVLAAGLKSGEIEKKQHPVWDEENSRKLLVWGYRPTNKPSAPEKPAPATSDSVAIVLSYHKRHPALSPSRLKEYLPKKLRATITKEQVAAIIKK